MEKDNLVRHLHVCFITLISSIDLNYIVRISVVDDGLSTNISVRLPNQERTLISIVRAIPGSD